MRVAAKGPGGKRAGARQVSIGYKNNGRPPHKPTPAMRETVVTCLGGGMRIEDIAASLRITEVTLRKHYPDELKSGKAMKHLQVMKHLFRQIENGVPSSTIFYLKTQCGWKETQRIEHAGITLAQLIEHSMDDQKEAA